MYTKAEYRERPDFRFVHDAKKHHHEALTATYLRGTPHFAQRHWVIQDMYDSEYFRRMLRLAAKRNAGPKGQCEPKARAKRQKYGMTGIQFSGDNIYWVNDSLYRFNVFAFVGELCERCHDLGLRAYFWTHEINGFFHEFVTNGRYGYSGQLIGGKIDLSSSSGYWQVLADKYDVFFRRMPGVDGLVLTLNECHVPVFRDELIESDLGPGERVARIARTVLEACRKHGKHLILRTFCYHPEELQTIRAGIEQIGEKVTLMMKCQPHDWHVFLPHNPLIEAFAGWDVMVEYDLALEFMGDGRQPAPQLDYLKYRFDHAAANNVNGVAGRICRFRNHAEGTLNWANVYAFSRLAHDPGISGDTLWNDYARGDYGEQNADFITALGRRLFDLAKETYYLAHEQRGVCNFNAFPQLDNWLFWNCAKWSPDDQDVQERYRLVCEPTPEFIAEVVAAKEHALAEVQALSREIQEKEHDLAPGDYEYLTTMMTRTAVSAEVHMTQHMVELMVRHDAKRPESERRFTAQIKRRIARLREIVTTKRKLVLAASAEGNQHNDVLVEVFCRRAERYLTESSADVDNQ